ncbi:MAG: hypothetical protein ACK50Y_04645 [Flavobacteriia bacterium]|jgi:hypothetical protein
MKTLIITLLFQMILIASCSTGVELKPVKKDALLHDMNSKIWMVEKVILNDSNVAPRINFDKDILVFYKSGRCVFQPMKTLGDFVGKQGEYSLDSEDMKLSLYFMAEKWDFNLYLSQEDTLILEPTKQSDLKYTMILVPFPEL